MPETLVLLEKDKSLELDGHLVYQKWLISRCSERLYVKDKIESGRRYLKSTLASSCIHVDVCTHTDSQTPPTYNKN